MSVEELARISRKYGSNPDYVLAGGGNTSFKDGSTLFVKASGFPLATITPEGFVAMDRAKLARIWDASYPDDSAAREARALEDLMNARKPGEESKRPSVETLVHEAHDEAYVVHTHPALVNGLTCSVGGERRMKELFGDELLWVPLVEPGYTLAKTVRRMRSAHVAAHGRLPKATLLQNHGIFVSSDDPAKIDETYRDVFEALARHSLPAPDLTPVAADPRVTADITSWIHGAFAKTVKVSFASNRSLLEALAGDESFRPLSSAYTPDHIVYSGHAPVYLTGTTVTAESVAKAVRSFNDTHRRDPKIVAVRSVGVFGIGANEKAAQIAITLFLDALAIGRYAIQHGGHQFLPDSMIVFIMNWEVESYRGRQFAG